MATIHPAAPVRIPEWMRAEAEPDRRRVGARMQP
jgi:hypothetical protein